MFRPVPLAPCEHTCSESMTDGPWVRAPGHRHWAALGAPMSTPSHITPRAGREPDPPIGVIRPCRACSVIAAGGMWRSHRWLARVVCFGLYRWPHVSTRVHHLWCFSRLCRLDVHPLLSRGQPSRLCAAGSCWLYRDSFSRLNGAHTGGVRRELGGPVYLLARLTVRHGPTRRWSSLPSTT